MGLMGGNPRGPWGPWNPMEPHGHMDPWGPWNPMDPWGPWGSMDPMGPWGRIFGIMGKNRGFETRDLKVIAVRTLWNLSCGSKPQKSVPNR